MKYRTRTRVTERLGGVVEYHRDRISQRPSYNESRDTCFDYYDKTVGVDGKLPPSDCVITKRRLIAPGWISGNREVTVRGIAEMASCACGLVSGAQAIDTTVRSDINAKDKGNLTYQQMLVSRSNPGRSEFSVYVFFRELLEILTMFAIPAKSIGQLAGGSYLNVKFGWMTFVRDIKTLDGIIKVIHSRFRELQTMAKHGGIRRKISLDSMSATRKTENYTMASVPANIRGTRTTTGTRKVHGVIRWTANPAYADMLSDLTPLDVWDEAVRFIFSANDMTPQDVWNMIPFSWLVDYFYDVNSLLGMGAHNGIFWPTEASIIRRDEYNASVSPTTVPDWLSCQPFHSRELIYDRDIIPTSGIYPKVNFDLSLSQLSTITALILKLKF